MYRLINRRRIRTARKMRFWRRRKTDMSRLRLCVFRSSKHIQVQLIDDKSHAVLATASSMEKDLRAESAKGVDMAKKVGALIATRAKEKSVEKVVFDRNGFNYHGRVKALADSAREAGLQF